MELYDSKFVYFDWDDELKGKKVIPARNIKDLKDFVERGDEDRFFVVQKGKELPFSNGCCDCAFVYYDPYYEFRRACFEGKQIQFKGTNDWVDIAGVPLFNANPDEYRIKPELRWHVVLSDEGTLGIAKSTNKPIYFTGDEEECAKWIDEHKGLIDIMKAWEEGKTIQYLHHDDWRDVAYNNPLWGLDNTYRIKPDDCKGCMKYNYCANKDGIRCKSYCTKVEYKPFDSVQELIDTWDKEHPSNTNRPVDTMPLIWIRNKAKNGVYLITDFLFNKAYSCDVGTSYENFKLTELFEDFTFLDGSIIGKEKE